MKIKFLMLLLTIGVISACSLDNGNDNCFYQQRMATKSVAGPSTTTINTEITLDVTFYVGNNCGTFNSFLETTTFPKNIITVVDYSGCSCNNTPTTDTRPYKFKSATPGTYELKFGTENAESPIVKTITVTAE